jgi:hypothetical protein
VVLAMCAALKKFQLLIMSSKGNRRITSGEKGAKNDQGGESKVLRQSAAGTTSGSGGNADDDYEKGKKTRSNCTNQNDLDADRKAVEDLEKWNY